MNQPPFFGTARAITKIALMTLWTLATVPFQIVLMNFHKGPCAYYIPQLWHRGVCKILGLRVRVIGRPVQNRQVMFVANHMSHLDIPVIGSFIRASFIAKAEVASWPVFGFLSRVQQTAFISRDSFDAAKVKDSLQSLLDQGKSLILFPEGTSTDGHAVLPFKSSLFSLVVGRTMAVQPFTLRLDAIRGRGPLTMEDRAIYGYYGDAEFGPHLWNFMKSRGADLTLAFHTAIEITPDMDRKTLARQAFDLVSSGLEKNQPKVGA